MKEIRQTFSEKGFKRTAQPQAAQTFSIPVANKKKSLYVFSVFMALILLFPVLMVFDRQHFQLYIAMPVIAICGLLMIYNGYGKFMTEQMVIELFKDKFTVSGRETYTLNFADIRDYKLFYYQGQSITITLHNGEVNRLQSSQYFDKAKEMEKFALAFEEAIQELKLTGDVDAERKKSMYDSKWFLIGLSAITVVVAILLIASVIKWHRLPPVRVFILFGPLAAFWSAYLITRKKKKVK